MTPLDRRRLTAMQRMGYRFVGGRGADLFSEAMKFALNVYNETDRSYGVVLDRGAPKKHGRQRRYDGPHNWTGQPVYWLRKRTW